MTSGRRRAGGFLTGNRRFVVLAAAVVILVSGGIGVALVLQDDGESPAATARTASTTPPPPATPSSKSTVVGAPLRLAIPDLDVNAAVLPVGTTREGAQEVPKSLDDTGWWEDGQLPGQPGNTVIVGHTASQDDGVFDELGNLAKDDLITVRTKDKKLSYVVTDEREIKVEDFAVESDRIYRETGRSGLVLMTCGDWNGKRFETTVIVYATAQSRGGSSPAEKWRDRSSR